MLWLTFIVLQYCSLHFFRGGLQSYCSASQQGQLLSRLLVTLALQLGKFKRRGKRNGPLRPEHLLDCCKILEVCHGALRWTGLAKGLRGRRVTHADWDLDLASRRLGYGYDREWRVAGDGMGHLWYGFSLTASARKGMARTTLTPSFTLLPGIVPKMLLNSISLSPPMIVNIWLSSCAP